MGSECLTLSSLFPLSNTKSKPKLKSCLMHLMKPMFVLVWRWAATVQYFFNRLWFDIGSSSSWCERGLLWGHWSHIVVSSAWGRNMIYYFCCWQSSFDRNRKEFDFIEDIHWVDEEGLCTVNVCRFFVQIAPVQHLLYSGDLAAS